MSITAEMTVASGNLATNLTRTGISRGFLAKQQQKEISQLQASITEEKRVWPNSSKCS